MVLSAITTLRLTKSEPLLDTRSIGSSNASPPIFDITIRPGRDRKTFSTKSYCMWMNKVDNIKGRKESALMGQELRAF